MLATAFHILMRLHLYAVSASIGNTLIELMIAFSVFRDTIHGLHHKAPKSWHCLQCLLITAELISDHSFESNFP